VEPTLASLVRAARRWGAPALTTLSVLLKLLLAVLTLLIGYGLGTALVRLWSTPTWPRAADLATPLLALGLVLMAVTGGDRKTVVLYLRHFGPSLATDLMRREAAWQLRRRFRMVTLADGVFKPLRLPWSARAVLWYAFPIWSAAALASLDRSMDTFARQALDEQAKTAADGGIIVLMLVLFATAFVLAGIAVFVHELFVLAATLGTAALLLHAFRIWRRSHLAVAADGDVAILIERLMSFRRWYRAPQFMAPPSVVVRVHDAQWRTVVREAAEQALVVIDVSSPTENILWELDLVTHGSAVPPVLVAARAEFEAWHDRGAGTLADKMRAAVRDHPVLMYEAGTRNGRRAFAAELGRLLEQRRSAVVKRAWPPAATAYRRRWPRLRRVASMWPYAVLLAITAGGWRVIRPVVMRLLG
jgi:hypothetical protein